MNTQRHFLSESLAGGLSDRMKLLAPFGPLSIGFASLAVGVAALLADGLTLRALIDAVLGWALLYAAWIDVRTGVVPNVVTLPLILVGLIMAWLAAPETLFFNEAAAAFAYLVLRFVSAAYRLARKSPGLGVGDAMLVAAAAAWLGPLLLGDVVLVSALIGLAMAVGAKLAGGRIKLDEKLAFGPAVALAFYIVRLKVG